MLKILVEKLLIFSCKNYIIFNTVLQTGQRIRQRIWDGGSTSIDLNQFHFLVPTISQQISPQIESKKWNHIFSIDQNKRMRIL